MKFHETIGYVAGFHEFIVLVKYKLLLLLLLVSFVIRANNPTDDKDESALVYEEIPVCVYVEGYNTFFLDALYTNKKLLYVDIADLFKMLNIYCQTGQNVNTLSGFIDKENQTFIFDYEKKVIKFGTNEYQSASRLIKIKEILYLESTQFNELFGISLNFNYRTLSIQLKTRFELPLNKQQRIEKTRKNLTHITGEVSADTVLQRKYHLMKFGTLDWAVTSTQTERESKRNQLKLSLGTELLFGEADVTLNYYDQQKFDNRQLYYLWHWVDNNKPYIKQLQIGILSPQTISFINSPIIGATIRNSPTTVRKATGYYSIDEYTEPNRDVELYINNVLIDYTKSDASGLFHFKVPIVYGYTTLKLKYYGPMGEEKTIERTMNVPYTIMPSKEFEYGLSTGIVEDSSRSRFARADLNYGINRYLTIGGGVEYLSSITNGSRIPFLTTTFQPFSKLTLNAEYAFGVKTKGQLNWYIKKDIFLEVEYTKYVEGQRATLMNALEERKARLSAPFSLNKMRGFIRFDYTRQSYKTYKYNQTNILFSAYYKLLSANSSTQINWTRLRTPLILSDLALYYRIGRGITISPSTQYDVCNRTPMTFRISFEKYINKGDFSISYERKISTQSSIINVNFKYDLKFARTGISISQQESNKTNSENPYSGTTVISESAQGSLAFGRGNRYTYKSNNPSVGRGGVSFYPFLDLNQNGKFDEGEIMVKISPSRFMGNKIVTEKDSILSIADLAPFTWYNIEFKDKDLENIAWRFKKNKYRILIDPNQFKRVDVPVVPVSEVDGMIYLNKGDQETGIGKIVVNFYDKKNNHKVAETRSERDGFFKYAGLKQGEYVARIDSLQLNSLNYTATPQQQEFKISSQKEGDQVSKIDFVLTSRAESISQATQKTITQTKFDIQISKLIFPKMIFLFEQTSVDYVKKSCDFNQLLNHTDNKIGMFARDTMIYPKRTILYDVQLYTSHQPIKSGDLFTQLIAKVPGIKIMEMSGKDGLYHYSTGVFLNKEEAYEYFLYIREKGWIFGYVDIYSGGKRKVITFK